MKLWNTELPAGGQKLSNVRIARSIFKGVSVSPFIFVIAMMPLTFILRKIRIVYQLKMGGEKVNH